MFRKALLCLPGTIWNEKPCQEEFIQILGNLSTTQFAMKKYFEANSNIELLLSLAKDIMPPEKIEKLKKRRRQCLKHTNPLEEEQKPRIPDYMPDRFKIAFDDSVGRIGVAEEDIGFGECILVDSPIACRGLLGSTQHCYYCLARIYSHTFPSPFDNNVRL